MPSRAPMDIQGDKIALSPLPVSATFALTILGFTTANLAPLILLALSDDRGLSVVDSGAVMTGSLLATALGSLAVARLCASPLRRTVARCGLLVSALGFGAAAVVPSAAVTTIGIMVGGLGLGGAVAAGGAALAAFRASGRAAGLSMLSNRAFMALLLLIVPIIGIGVLSTLGLIAVLSLAALVIMSWLPDATPRTVPTPAPQTRATPAPSRSARTGWILLIAFTIWAISEDSLWALSGAMGATVAGVSDHLLGVLLGVATAAGIAAALIVSVLGDRLGRMWPMVILLVIGGGAKILLPLIADPAAFAAVLIVWNFAYSMVFTFVIATAAALDAAGRWSSAILGVYLVGSSLAPIVGAWLSETIGYGGFGLAIGVTSLILVLPLGFAAHVSMRSAEPGAHHQRETTLNGGGVG